MAASLAPSRSVPIALLYQAPSLHQHLKQALSDLGASVVYDTPAENFDRGALDRSGAEVVVINLDPDVDEEFEHLGDLLADEALKVIFNDGEVSSRLEGWDQARWARHLAAKILGVSDTNPPRPQGSSAISVKVRSAAPEYPGAPQFDGGFELHGQEFERALSADTGESISLTRAALVTKDEPVAAQLVPPPDPKDIPTLELPVGDLVRDIPQWRQAEAAAGAAATAPAAAAAPAEPPPAPVAPRVAAAPPAAAATPPAAAPAPVPPPAVAEEFAAVLRDFGFLNEPTPAARAATSPAPADDEFDALGALDAATGVTPGDDEFSDFGLSLESDEPASRVAVQELDEISFDDEPVAAAPTRQQQAIASDELSLDELDIESISATAIDAPLSDFDIGSIELEPFDESGSGSTFGNVPESAAPRGLDDFLFDLSLEEGDKGSKEARPAKPEKPVAVEAARHAASMRATPTVEGKVLSSGRPQMDEPARPAPAAPAMRPAPIEARQAESAATPAAPRKFEFSGLSLEPTEEELLSAPVTGRASYRIDEVERHVPPPPMPVVAPPQPAAMPVADDDEFSLGALEFTLDETAPINTSSVVRGTAVESEEEPDLMAELEAVVGPTAPVVEAPVDGPVRRVWVLGASIGGPEAVREFLAAIEPGVPALFLLAQHMGSDFVDLMTQQLARATKLNVRNVAAGDKVAYGDVVVVPLSERMQVDAQGSVKLSALDSMSPYSPSIDQVLMDVADRFGANAGAIIFSGMAHDAIDGSVYLSQKGGKVWAQDPATCVISSMVDGARDAGVVTFTGSPAELARQFQLLMFRAG